jgi:ABC-type Fe3+/spermidine/putrescine transport system ATPase subunit
VLFLDEPLSNLDAALRGSMRSELSRLHRETGVTTVYVTHDQSEALALSDQILVMRLGEVIEKGSPTDVYERPQTLYGAKFVGAANCLTGTLTEVDSGEAVVTVASGERLRARAEWLQSPDLGSPVTVVVRPEDVEVAAPDQAVNVLSGKVRQASYFGSHRELLVAIGGDEVKVQAPKGVRGDLDEVLRLHLPVEALRILPQAGLQSELGADQTEMHTATRS